MKTAITIAALGIVSTALVVSVSAKPVSDGERVSGPYLGISCAEGRPSGTPCKESKPQVQESQADKVAEMCLGSGSNSIACSK